MAKTRAQLNRAVRQEALRDQLAEQCRLQHIIETIQEMYRLDEGKETFTNSLNKLKTVNEQRMRLLNKYLPDLKSTELTGDAGESLTITVTNYSDKKTKK